MREPEVWIGVMVIAVILGGYLLVPTGDRVTGQAIADSCDCTPGVAVCGAIGQHIEDYPSSCHAVCAGARVVFENRCGHIPQI